MYGKDCFPVDAGVLDSPIDWDKPITLVGDPMVSPVVKISVYLDDSRIFTYEVTASTPEARQAKVRDHVHAVGTRGLITGPEDGLIEYVPPHRITKIKAYGHFSSAQYVGKWGGA